VAALTPDFLKNHFFETRHCLLFRARLPFRERETASHYTTRAAKRV
jgi:hypothetical protein